MAWLSHIVTFLYFDFINLLQIEDGVLSCLVEVVQVEIDSGDRFALLVSDDIISEEAIKR